MDKKTGLNFVETELRKRAQGILKQTTCVAHKTNGHMPNTTQLTKYTSDHETSYKYSSTYLIMSPTTMAAAKPANKAYTVLTYSNRGASMNRRFSESSADELYRSTESFKRSSWNQNMHKELLNNDRQKRKTGCCFRFCRYDDDDEDIGGCCCFVGGSRKNRISDAIDVGIRVMLVFIFISLENTKPFKRKVHPEEMWLYKNPRSPDIVSVQALLLSAIFVPLSVTIAHLWLTGDRRDFRAASWVWTLALGLNGLVTSLLKITVGRHRPDFFYRCFPDGIEVLNNGTNADGSMDWYNCTGDIRQISEGRKSFPSGHASFSFVGFGFIAIYVGAKLHALNARGRGQSWRLCVTLLPIILAALIAVSRTCDYHHHWEDVFVGSLIGLSITYIVYRQYYPSVFSSSCHRPYFRICGRSSESSNQLNSQPKLYEPVSTKDGIDDESISYEDQGDASRDERRRLI
ncbi:phospholipid phosphatase 5 isoform X1 [Rhagoletis pomonella]|uniref:phospholipid phosphatase 5 isoform X1 n=2 Tax=Rhagoletis pomonella TaxID=28610 RepID=UPI00177F70F0|nr:phospholipid phosphatase 5 isoform X1 [Rhagoletis pomonella]